jgi:hypothetical protein
MRLEKVLFRGYEITVENRDNYFCSFVRFRQWLWQSKPVSEAWKAIALAKQEINQYRQDDDCI